MMNWNVCPWQKMALLMRAPIDGIIDKVAPDSAQIKQRIALGRSTVTHHRTSLVFRRDQEIQKFAFSLFYFLTEANISFQISNCRSALSGSEVFDAFFRRFARIFLMPQVNS